MTPKKIISISVLALALVAALILGVTYFNVSNAEIALRNQAEAKQKQCYLVHAEMKQSVQEIGGVADAYMLGFDSMYTKIIGARYQANDGTLMKWIQESNPAFDVSLYKKLANIIEAKRAEFRVAQSELLDVAREHQNLVQQAPGSWFLSGRDSIKVQIVTSSKTVAAFASGVDDEVYKAGQR